MLKSIVNVLNWVVDRLCLAASQIAAVLLIAMFFLVALDVLLRFIGGLTVLSTVSFEIVEIFLALIVFLSLPYAGLTYRHITIEVLLDRLPQTLHAIFKVTVSIVSLVLLSLLIWQTILHGLHFWKEGQTFSVLDLSVHPFLFIAAFCIILLALVILRDLLEFVSKEFTKGKWRLLVLWATPLASVIFLGWIVLFQPGGLDAYVIGLIGIVAMIALLFSGMYVALVIMLIGFLGMGYISGAHSGLAMLETVPFTTVSFYPLSVIPLFIILGELAFAGELTKDLYKIAHKWFGRLPGGLAITTIAACAGFSACSGSSIATAATMGEVALPEMKRFKYDHQLATGCVAAGGTLGILIPPSSIMIIYAILTEVSIGKLFIAGILPGILLAISFMISIYIRAKINVQLGPPGPPSTTREKITALKHVWALTILVLIVIGGIYSGVFTPNEAAGIGAFAAFLIALVRRRLTPKILLKASMETVQISTMVFFIIIAANIFGYFMAVSRIPAILADFLSTCNIPPNLILICILFAFFLFGCIGEAVTMMIIAVPILQPSLEAVGVNIIHFGILMVMVIETAAITPPVGMNVFVIKGVAPSVPLSDIYRGIMPFLLVLILCMLIILFFPQISLVLIH